MNVTQNSNQLELQSVRVLELVNHDVLVAILHAVTNIGFAHQYAVWLEQKVIKIDAVATPQRRLVVGVNLSVQLMTMTDPSAGELIRQHVVVLGFADVGQHLTDLCFDFHVGQDQFQHPLLVVAVVDREVSP